METHEPLSEGVMASTAPEIYLDTETQRAAAEVPGGWTNIPGFGLSVAVTWDSDAGFREWFEDQVPALVNVLAAAERVVTFNGERFDFPVLSAYAPVEALYPKSFDILVDLKRRLGYRVSLQSLAQATLGRSKAGTGMEALLWWRSGDPVKRRQVVEYCRRDVELLRDCVAFGRKEGYVRIPDVTEKLLTVYVSWVTSLSLPLA